MVILASLASADPLRLAGSVDSLEGWPHLHFDIEDGNFTPNLTFGHRTLAAAGRYIAPRRLDVHLMVTDPVRYLPCIRDSGAESVTAHIEALRFPLVFLNTARQMGLRAGLALNLSTPWQAVLPFADRVDRLLVMTSEPDGLDESLNETALRKAEDAARNLPFPVYADGGISLDSALRLRRAGAAGVVMGRAIFAGGTPAETVRELKNALDNE